MPNEEIVVMVSIVLLVVVMNFLISSYLLPLIVSPYASIKGVSQVLRINLIVLFGIFIFGGSFLAPFYYFNAWMNNSFGKVVLFYGIILFVPFIILLVAGLLRDHIEIDHKHSKFIAVKFLLACMVLNGSCIAVVKYIA